MQKPILIDLDGVLRVDGKPATGLLEFLDFMQTKKIPACILSNSTIADSKQILDFFQSHNIEIQIPIITAIDAAYIYLKDKYENVAVYTSENVVNNFAEFFEYEKPEAVLIGDIGDVWNYKLMQTIFEYVRNGAELIAAHKNKFWTKPEKGTVLDAGPFIHAIEYATNTEAILIGKPSKLYFNSALKKIGMEEKDFIMIGDDLDSDISGSKLLNAETILMLTGKTQRPIPKEFNDKIDRIAENLLEVVKILED